MLTYMEITLKVIIGITNTIKLGKKTCLTGLKNYSETIKEMLNKNKLKNERKETEKSQGGKEYWQNSYNGVQKIYINEEEWRWDNEEGNLQKLNKAKLSKH